MRKKIAFLILSLTATSLSSSDGKKVFETYCWGCHHQTAVAFGPPFEEIASKRTSDEIRAMISDPKSVSKVFGYRRNAMPAFTLSDENLTAITNYILSYKVEESNSSRGLYIMLGEGNLSIEKNIIENEINKTVIENPYSTVASMTKEKK